jgi:hypothetical protein
MPQTGFVRIAHSLYVKESAIADGANPIATIEKTSTAVNQRGRELR